MKHKYCLIVLYSILVSTLNIFAQDWTKWHLPEGAVARLGKGVITDIAYSPDGSRLIVSSRIGIWIYDVQTTEVLNLIKEPYAVNHVSFSPDGKLLACVGFNTFRLYDAATGTIVQTIRLDEPSDPSNNRNIPRYIRDVSFSPDGKLVATCSRENRQGIIRLWDVSTGQRVQTLTHSHATRNVSISVDNVVFSPDGKLLASGSSDNAIRIWELATGQERRTLSGYGGLNVVFSPDGKLLASILEFLETETEKSLRLWRVDTGALVKQFGGRKSGSLCVAFSPDGKILASGSIDKTIRLWELRTGNSLLTLKGHTQPVSKIAFSPDSNTLTSASINEVRFWDVETGNIRNTIKGHASYVRNIAVSPDGKTIASGHGVRASIPLSSNVQLWDVNTRTRIHTLAHDGYALSVAFSPDGQQLAIGGQTDSIYVYRDVKNSKLYRLFLGHETGELCVAFSPDGKLLASGDTDGVVRIWDVNINIELDTLKEHSSEVTSVTFSPDGKTLATASSIDGVRL